MPSKCPVAPCADFVVLQPVDVPSTTKIVLLTNVDDLRGRVVAVGPDADDALVGELVLYRRHAETKVTVGDEVWLLLQEEDLLCRLA